MKHLEHVADKLLLHNGYGIPCVGFGTWQMLGDAAVKAIKTGISYGYRHIDTAPVYQNEKSVGQAIRECGVPREELFITSKLWNTERGYDKTMAAFERTMQDLGLEYLDLYLIHWPASPHQFDNWEDLNRETWRAMTDLYKKGRIKAIGVSNFLPHHLKALMEMEVKPMVNQMEYHPGMLQLKDHRKAYEYCRENDIQLAAYSPMGNGRMLRNPLLMELADKYHKSVAQLCIRWCLQNDVLPLPKTATPERIRANMEVFDFVISEEDMAIIDGMAYCGGSGEHPDEIEH